MMRALIIIEQGPIAPPMDHMAGLVEAVGGWRQRWRHVMPEFQFFAGRAGGWGVFEGEQVDLSQSMMEYPLGPYSQVQVHPSVDGDDALVRLGHIFGYELARADA